jgi:hypothetical protein
MTKHHRLGNYKEHEICLLKLFCHSSGAREDQDQGESRFSILLRAVYFGGEEWVLTW